MIEWALQEPRFTTIPPNLNRKDIINAIVHLLPVGADPELSSTFTFTPIPAPLPSSPAEPASEKELACKSIDKLMGEISLLLNYSLQIQENGDMRASFRTLRDLARVLCTELPKILSYVNNPRLRLYSALCPLVSDFLRHVYDASPLNAIRLARGAWIPRLYSLISADFAAMMGTHRDQQ